MPVATVRPTAAKPMAAKPVTAAPQSPAAGLTQLASLIQAHAGTLENTLSASNAPQPGPTRGLPLAMVPHLQDTRDQLLGAIEDLKSLILGPLGHLLMLTQPLPAITSTLQVLYRYRIPHQLGMKETTTYKELSRRCGLTEDDTRRFVRMAISLRLFEEPGPGLVCHSPSSAAMRNISALDDWIGLTTEELIPNSLRTADSLEKHPGSQEPAECAAALANGSKGDFDFVSAMGNDPERIRRYANGMSLTTNLPSHAVTHMVEHVGWDRPGADCPRRVVEMGSPSAGGDLSKELLRRYPDIERATVLELPDVVATADVPDDLIGDLFFQEYDFSTEQPIHDADVYLMRNVFRDWSDKYAVTILQNQIPALKPGARIIINETCLPATGKATRMQNHLAGTSDLMMKMTYNGKERTRNDWCRLFAAADPRFRVKSIRTPRNASLAVIEAVWQR